MARRIDYGAGFLPQNLYQNLLNIQQQGLAERNRRDLQRARDIGGLAGMVGRMDTGRSAEAEKDFIAKRDAELARMKQGLKNIDPINAPKLYQQQLARINQFEMGSQQAMDRFKDSGFLGFARDRGALQLPDSGRKPEGFDSEGVQQARAKQQQMVGEAQGVRDRAFQQYQDREREVTDRLLDVYDLEEEGPRVGDRAGQGLEISRANINVDAAQDRANVAKGFLQNRERFLRGVQDQGQQVVDEALVQQAKEREGQIYNAGLGIYQDKESFAPIAEYERGFEDIKRRKLIEYDPEVGEAERAYLDASDKGALERMEKYLPQMEKIKRGLDVEKMKATRGEARKQFVLDELAKIYQIEPDKLKAELTRDKQFNEQALTQKYEELAKLSPLQLSIAREKYQQESGLALDADLKRMDAVEKKKIELRKSFLADSELTKAEREKQVGDILALGGAKMNLEIGKALTLAGIDLDFARRKIIELSPLETQELVKRINATAEPEAQAAALKTALTGEAAAEVARNTTQRNLTDKYGVTFSETGQMLGKNGEPVNLMDLEAEFTDKNNKKQTVQEALINMAKNASTDEEVQQVNQLLMMNGYSAEQAQAFAEFAQQNKGRLEQGLKRAALSSPAFSKRQQFNIAKDLGIVGDDVEFDDVKGRTEFIDNLIEKGIDVPDSQLKGTVYEGKEKQVQALVSESRLPKRKEGILRNLNSIMETMVDEENVGLQQYNEYLGSLSEEDQRLVMEMGFSQNVVSTSAAKLLLEKARTEQKLNADVLVKNAEKKLKLAQASYYDAQTKTEGGDITKIRSKALFDGIARIYNNEQMLPADKEEAIKGLTKRLDPDFGKEQLAQLEAALARLSSGEEEVVVPEKPPPPEVIEPPKFTKPITETPSDIMSVFSNANPNMAERLTLNPGGGGFRGNTIIDRFIGEFSDNGRSANKLMDLIAHTGSPEELAKILSNSNDPIEAAKLLYQEMGKTATRVAGPLREDLIAIAEGYRGLNPRPVQERYSLPQ